MSEAEDIVNDVSKPSEPSSKSSSKPAASYRTDPADYDTWMEAYSVRVANRPCTFFWLSLIFSLGLGIFGVVVGEFSVAVDNDGW
jgi:hypothetical protein